MRPKSNFNYVDNDGDDSLDNHYIKMAVDVINDWAENIQFLLSTSDNFHLADKDNLVIANLIANINDAVMSDWYSGQDFYSDGLILCILSEV